MNKYRIYFNDQGKKKYQMAITYVFGHSEEDAILRAGYNQKYIDSINRTY